MKADAVSRDENFSENSAESAAAESPLATEETTIVTRTRFRRRKQIPDEPVIPPEPDEEEEDPEPGQPVAELLPESDELDDYDLLLEEIAADPHHSWIATVERLPDYHKPNSPFYHRSDRGVTPVQNCGIISAFGDFREEVRSRFARGAQSSAFRVRVKKDGRFYANLRVWDLMPAHEEVRPADYAQPAPALWQQSSDNPLNAVKDAIKLAKDMVGLADVLPQPKAVAPPAPAAPTELPIEAALIRIIASDKEMVSQAVNRLLGRQNPEPAPERENSGGGFLMEFGRALGSSPEIQQMIITLTATLAGSVMSRVTQGSQAAPTAPAQPAAPQLTPEQHLLNTLLHACASNQPPQAVAAWLLQFQEQYPQVDAWLEGFVNLPPASALQLLASHLPDAAALIRAPHVAAWTQALQDALAYEETPPPASEGHQQPA
jgi:hypothetical protein